MAEAEHRGDLYAVLVHKTTFCNVTWLAEDDLAGARREIVDAKRRWNAPGFQIQHHWILLAEGMADLYAGEPGAALARLKESWPALQRSLLLRAVYIKAPLMHLRASVALGVAESERDSARRAELLRSVERDARTAGESRVVGYSGLALLLYAGVAALRGDKKSAAGLLRDAVRGLDDAEVLLYAAGARACLGEILGGEEGAKYLAEAQAFMASQGIKNFSHMRRLLTPGFRS